MSIFSEAEGSGPRYEAKPTRSSITNHTVSFSMAIGHRENDVVIVDALRERKPPFSPEDVVAEFSELLKSYRISKIAGDRYAGEWPSEQFRKLGIAYEPAQKPKSDLYRDMLPIINSRKLDLLDDARLLTQLVGLERRTARGGRDSIDHTPGAHDDLANAVAGSCAVAAKRGYDTSMDWVGGPGDVTACADWQRRQFANYVASGAGRRPLWLY